jgi:mxaA protein
VACAAGVALAAWSAEPPAASPVRTLEPRAYGYVVGDLIERQVQLQLPAGQRLDEQTLPRPGRVGPWFELVQARLSGTPQQPGAALQLDLRYQLMNAPPNVRTLALPALRLGLLSAAASAVPQVLEVPDWPVSAAPITPEHVLSRAGLPALQPDLLPEPQPLAPLQWRIAAWWCLALAAGGVLLLRRHPALAFWRRSSPLRQAWLQLRRLQGQQRGQPDAALAAQARRLLHQALDGCAGRALFAGQLAPLYAARPELQPLAAEIERFFARSNQAFFDPAAPPADPQQDLHALVLLARRLAQAEGGP